MPHNEDVSSPWKPLSGKAGFFTCTEHGGEFPRGHHCSRCQVGAVSYGREGSEAQQIAAEAKDRRLASMLDHEAWFQATSEKAERMADELAPPKRAPRKTGERGRPRKRATSANAIAVQRLLETAIKARSRAAAITEWREDWERTERLRKLNARFGGAEPRGTAATQDPASGAN